MPRGISLAIAHLAIVSTISKNSAPNSIETGSKTLKFAPTIVRHDESDPAYYTAKSHARSRQQGRSADDNKAIKFDVYAHGFSFFFAKG